MTHLLGSKRGIAQELDELLLLVLVGLEQLRRHPVQMQVRGVFVLHQHLLLAGRVAHRQNLLDRLYVHATEEGKKKENREKDKEKEKKKK